ncbi:MAG: hypothetical protein J5611_02370 [Alphaproteobacteria bacterium]|nr:hypothetical protein [Alphaproteobacteria bacterium]
MKKRSVGNLYKNAVGTVFLLIGAFFVCSTLLSMRAVLADPVAPVAPNNTAAGVMQSGRASASRANPRGNAASTVRPTRQTSASNASRGTSGRNVVSRTNTSTTAATNSARSVVARTATNRTTSATRGTRARTVRARTASDARVSLSGDAIRGSKGNTNSTYYTYLNGKLYTGNYSNIIDASTGLISADAYSACLESYYTCMDEICTARNETQRRCACAGRVKSFAAAENALESANAELVRLAGELTLLNANKGKEVSAAFTLTEAEQVMNCVSWREASQNGTSDENFGDWCAEHGLYSDCSYSTAPKYCYKASNNNLFDVGDLNGTSSDILSALSLWADTIKENSNTILKQDDDAVTQALRATSDAVSGLTGGTINLNEDEVIDTLAETWGYDLFGYAHNNVCARVLDSCFNGIYEACGTPPSGGRCANGANSSCPYNYNSKVTITSAGDVTLNERSTNSANSSATCFGYTSTSGDPYSALRGPVADARRSIMQKYLLDANADCDLYGEQLKTAAQKLNLQRVAAQQALQQKRLEFYNEEQDKILSDATAAGTNFNECVSELWECYDTASSAHHDWSTSRVKTYCAQIANAPHCYQDMICNPSYASFKAIIDKEDSASCKWHSSDYTQNNCRNIVTLNEILRSAADGVAVPTSNTTTGDSAAFRESCLQEALGCPGDGCIREWTNPYANTTGN